MNILSPMPVKKPLLRANKIFVCAALLACSAPSLADPASVDPASAKADIAKPDITKPAALNYTLTYKVVLRNIVAGTLVVSVSEADNGAITLHSETFPNSLAKLFGDGKVVEIIKYAKTNGELRLQSVKEIQGEAQTNIKESVVNWQAKTITSNGETSTFAPDTQMDAYTLPFLRVLGLDDASEGSNTKVLNARKTQDYVYQQSVQETLKINAKSYPATRHTKHRLNNKNRAIALWLSDEPPVIPLKIAVNKKGKARSWVILTDIKHH